MPWRITETTDNQHIGTVLQHVEKGHVIQFEDGDVVSVDNVFTTENGNQIMAVSANYHMTLVKET